MKIQSRWLESLSGSGEPSGAWSPRGLHPSLRARASESRPTPRGLRRVPARARSRSERLQVLRRVSSRDPALSRARVERRGVLSRAARGELGAAGRHRLLLPLREDGPVAPGQGGGSAGSEALCYFCLRAVPASAPTAEFSPE